MYVVNLNFINNEFQNSRNKLACQGSVFLQYSCTHELVLYQQRTNEPICL